MKRWRWMWSETSSTSQYQAVPGLDIIDRLSSVLLESLPRQACDKRASNMTCSVCKDLQQIRLHWTLLLSVLQAKAYPAVYRTACPFSQTSSQLRVSNSKIRVLYLFEKYKMRM
jgi:hypothetical protein